jgi:apolipoprotein D and lipocalin family protein
MIKIFLLSLVIFFTGCSNKDSAPLDTVKNVNIDKYQGTWYEIARFEHFFEKGCKNVTATYKLNEDKIDVTNRCVKIDSNEIKIANGVAYSTNNENSKLKVSFFRPFYGDYWILDLEENYEYVLVGTPSREYLWILSREKLMNSETKFKLVNKAKSLGFDTDKFIWTIQD